MVLLAGLADLFIAHRRRGKKGFQLANLFLGRICAQEAGRTLKLLDNSKERALGPMW
jgi:hypothetical protein